MVKKRTIRIERFIFRATIFIFLHRRNKLYTPSERVKNFELKNILYRKIKKKNILTQRDEFKEWSDLSGLLRKT